MKPTPSTGTVVLLSTLGLMLLGASFFAFEAFSTGNSLPGHFYIAMTLGVFFTLIVGMGLMALTFYSSRNGYDEPPTFRDEC